MVHPLIEKIRLAQIMADPELKSVYEIYGRIRCIDCANWKDGMANSIEKSDVEHGILDRTPYLCNADRESIRQYSIECKSRFNRESLFEE